MKKKKILIIGLVSVAAIAAVYMGSQYLKSKVSNIGFPVQVETVSRDTIITNVSAKGEVSLLNSELIFANTNAEVEEVLVEKNDMVKKGDVLLRYKEKSKEKIENQLREAELNLKSAEISLNQETIPASETDLENARMSIKSAEDKIKDQEYAIDRLERDLKDQEKAVEDAKKTVENTKLLYEAGAASKDELTTAEDALKTAENLLVSKKNDYAQNVQTMESLRDNLTYQNNLYNQLVNKNSTQQSKNTVAQRQISVEQMRLRVDELRKDLADFQYEIISPIDGTVTELNISKGAITPTDKALMEISNIEDFVVKVNVNERNAAKIATGQVAEIKGSVLGDERASGKITKIGYIAEQKQSSSGGMETVIPVEITVDPSEASKLLKPGFSLEAIITTQVKENVVALPILSTLKESNGDNFVYVVKEDNTLEKRIVTLGVYSDMTVEAEGVSEGETIVAQPTFDMHDGMKITPISANAEAEGDQPEAEGEGK